MISPMPCPFRYSIICSRNGLLAIGTMDLGVFRVRGRSLVPSPPTRSTAFTSINPSAYATMVWLYSYSTQL